MQTTQPSKVGNKMGGNKNDSHGTYSTNDKIKFKNTMLKSRLCH